MVVWNGDEISGAIAGGILISLATALNHFLYGKTEGMHGMFDSLFKRGWGSSEPDFVWKICFLFGVVTLPYLTLRGTFNTAIDSGTVVARDVIGFSVFG